MAWSISDLFPPWGDGGSRPSDNFQYDGGDQVNEKHLDYLWSQVGKLENETRSALTEIDSDSDGIVDESDTTNLYKGNDIDPDGDGIVEQYDETLIKDGGSREVDAAELAGGLGTSGEVLQTDGANASWQGVADFPSNAIAIWSGSITNIPSGWVLCDGNNGTPNLQDRFVVGAGSTYAVGATGGSNTHILSQSELASHSHGIEISPSETSDNNVTRSGDEFDSLNDVSSQAIQSTGGDSAHENRPPYYALAYIMKV